MNEGGYKLFISVLKDDDNKHLFLESLDCIKLFLMTRSNLERFREIPRCIQLDRDCPELNVSFLQVLAILSFEKKNHSALKKVEFLNKLESEGMFNQVFEHFDRIEKEQKTLIEILEKNENASIATQSRRIAINSVTENSEAVSQISHSMQMHSNRQSHADMGASASMHKNSKNDLNRTRQVELALAISIILSNLSNDEEYIKVLLGADKWLQRYQE